MSRRRRSNRSDRADLVLDDVRQRRLNDLARVVRLLGRPIPEAGGEAVAHGGDPVVLEHLGQRGRLHCAGIRLARACSRALAVGRTGAAVRRRAWGAPIRARIGRVQ